jgi:hypothetical protein
VILYDIIAANDFRQYDVGHTTLILGGAVCLLVVLLTRGFLHAILLWQHYRAAGITARWVSLTDSRHIRVVEV